MDKVRYEFQRQAPLSAGGHLIKNVDLKSVMAANRDRKNSKSPKKRTPKAGIWSNKVSRKYLIQARPPSKMFY